ncbi:MAG: RecB-like helicase, partial [Campylobacterota bacterium]
TRQLIAQESGLSEDTIKNSQEMVKKRFLHSSANILNIDKFFTKILHAFSFEAHLDPNFRVKSSIDKSELFEKFIKKCDDLDRFITLLEVQGTKPLNIFDLFNTIYENEPLLPKIDTRYNYKNYEKDVIEAMDALHQEIQNCKVASNSVKKAVSYTDIDDIAKKSFLQKESLSEHNYFKKCYTPKLDEDFFRLKDALKRYTDEKERYILSNLFHFYHLYKSLRYDKHALQFNDITLYVLELLQGVERDFLYFRLDSRYKHILIDEFQDTSLMQFQIFKPLIDEITSGYSLEELRSFFYVGDVKQSIYRFRGGQKELFYELAQRYPIQMRQMRYNYRSSASVVNFVNQHFTFLKGFIPQTPVHTGGYVAVNQSQDEKLITDVIKQTKQLLQLGYDPNEIAVLTFKNKDAQEIEYALRTSGVKVVTESSVKLIHNPKVAALICGLRYLVYKQQIDKEVFLFYCNSDDKQINYNFKITDTPLKVLQTLIQKYNFFDGDTNIILLLQLAQQYSDIIEFLEDDIDELQTNSSINGVKVMTVHKSKGLEFTNTILVDSLSADSNRSSKLILQTQDIAIENIYVNFSKRENFDSNFAQVKKREKELSSQDLAHTLYVALTRAKTNMFINFREKSSKFAMLNLTPTTIGSLERSDKKHYSYESNAKKIVLKQITQQQVHTQSDDKTYDYEATLYGTALHYTLEQLEHFSLSKLEDALQSCKNRFGESVDIHSIKNRIKLLLNNELFCDLIRGKIIKEKQILTADTLKQLDLLIQKEDKYIIIDYKTSEKSKIKHKQQVQEYIQIMQELSSYECEGYICYLLKDSCSVEKI